MDYEKKYNEALEKARKLYNDAKANEYKSDMEDYESIFPELAESEDERIRKELVAFFKAMQDSPWHEEYWHDLEIVRILAYFEKQKEEEGYEAIPVESTLEYKLGFKAGKESEKQKDVNKAIEAVERIDKYIDENLANAHDMKDSNPDKKYYRGWDDALGEMSRILQDVYSVENQKERKEETLRDFIDNFPYSAEQKEQKPVEWSDTKELVFKDICNHLEVEGYSGWVVLLNALRNGEFQPKQEWSEEDEKTIDDAFCWLCEYAGSLIQKNYGKSSMLYGIANKLKSLHPHPKQEWSEEEKEILDSILSHYVLIDKPTDANGIPKEKYISLIKSIRFDTYKKCNSHWKPSEEQMNALYDILHPADTVNRLALESLYEQLKAL